MLSFTEENYLKAVFKLTAQSDSVCGTNDLAGELNTKAGSVTEMLKRLKEKKLLDYAPYKGVSLTGKGRKIAVNIIRKHRLWECFLVNTLGFGWDEVHEIAEELEHIRSERLVDRLDQFLGYPKFDPHGDPIPDKEGKMKEDKSVKLSEARPGKKYEISGVLNHENVFLQYLGKMGLTPGTSLKVKELVEFDGSLHIELNKEERVFVSNNVAQLILVTLK